MIRSSSGSQPLAASPDPARSRKRIRPVQRVPLVLQIARQASPDYARLDRDHGNPAREQSSFASKFWKAFRVRQQTYFECTRRPRQSRKTIAAKLTECQQGTYRDRLPLSATTDVSGYRNVDVKSARCGVGQIAGDLLHPLLCRCWVNPASVTRRVAS